MVEKYTYVGSEKDHLYDKQPVVIVQHLCYCLSYFHLCLSQIAIGWVFIDKTDRTRRGQDIFL